VGSYDGDKMLFLGLGTGLGAALVGDHVAVPLEVAHLPYEKSFTFEDCVGKRGHERMGQKRWEKAVHDVVARLKAATVADYVVLGGGNAKLLKKLPADSRPGDNEKAFLGGTRIWQEQFRVL
jgi:polyphosphate glucokinase